MHPGQEQLSRSRHIAAGYLGLEVSLEVGILFPHSINL